MRHEVHLARRGLTTVAAVVPVVLAGAGLLRGPEGAASAVLGAGVIVANQALAVASTAWSRGFGRTAAVTGYAGWFLRMAAVLAAMSFLAGLAWVDRPSLAVSFCLTLAVLLGAECVSYVRGSYVPAWRVAR